MTQKEPFRIVVGFDLSDIGDLAVGQAIRLAERYDSAHLHVVHVITPKDLKASPSRTKLEQESDILELLPKQIWARLGEVSTRVASRQSEGHASVHLRSGKPAETIHQVAVDYDADIIVVGTHARRGLKKIALGSVAEELIRTSHCPVLVARPKSFDGLEKSEQIEPVREGVAIPDARESHIYRSTQLTTWQRPSWLGGA